MRYFQRELSWLAFNERVLEEALDKTNPLLERLKFLAIFVSNLDEFFMIRVSGIKRLIDAGYKSKDEYGYTPREVYEEMDRMVKNLVGRLYKIYEGVSSREMPENNISLLNYSQLNSTDKLVVDEYFATTLFALITPMAVDQGHPFPILPSKTLSFWIRVARNRKSNFVVLPIPSNISRVFKLPSSSRNQDRFILVDEIIRGNMASFFIGFSIEENALFRIIRDGDLALEEEYSSDLLKTIEREVKKRPRAKSIRVEIERSVSKLMLEKLCEHTEVPADEVNVVKNNLDLTFLFDLTGQLERPELRFRPFLGRFDKVEDMFAKIRDNDFVVHHPFESFDPVQKLVRQAAADKDVLAIKMTLYRIDSDSLIIEALKEAASSGKQVTVLVELKARFDEERNISWAKQLEKAGCHVIYGIPGIKIHSKIMLIVRREETSIRRYMHLGTGNYNEKTSRLYTDMGLFTANEDFARDIADTFNVISGYSMPPRWRKVTSAPYDLRRFFYTLVDQEIEFQKNYGNGLIMAKINSLADTQIIEKLYEASNAGVKIRLLVRGICCLVPGVKGMSENIEVRSVVGRFLEHSRIYLFNSNDQRRFYFSSADWMTRNLDRRIELLFPIEKEKLKKHIMWIFKNYWKDNAKSRQLMPDGTYVSVKKGKERFDIQDYLIDYYAK